MAPCTLSPYTAVLLTAPTSVQVRQQGCRHGGPGPRLHAAVSELQWTPDIPHCAGQVQTLQQEGIQSGSPGRLSKLCSIRCAGDRHVQAACLRSDGSALAWAEGGHVRLLHINPGASGAVVRFGAASGRAGPAQPLWCGVVPG